MTRIKKQYHNRPIVPGLTAQQEWFREARFGIFIHFGLYSLLSRDSEWVMRNELIPRDVYARLTRRFRAPGFSAAAWVAAARRAGARYMVVTAKHLDGFCLWDSALTDYKSTNTPFGRDLVGELAEECHRTGMRLVLYYSIPDWHHPAYPHGRHCMDWPVKRPGDSPDAAAYLAYLEGQIRELMTNYGRIDGIWWDGEVSSAFGKWTGKGLVGLVRRLQPQAVMNNRAGFPGDFFTPERCLPEARETKSGRYFEACDSLGSRSWGFVREDIYYSVERTLGAMIQAFAGGGNYLLNAGPDGAGRISRPCQDRLRRIGDWLRLNGEAVFGTQPCPVPIGYWRADSAEPAGYVTRNGRVLFGILRRWPDMDSIVLLGLRTIPRRGTLLGYPSARLSFMRLKHGIQVAGLPAAGRNGQPVVMKLNFAEEPVFDLGTIRAATPGVLDVVPGRALILGAGQARVSGGGGAPPKLKFLSRTDTCFGWFRVNHCVEWDLNVTAPGKFKVIVSTGCPRSMAGSEFKVIVDGRCFTGKVPPTEDYQDFKAQCLGTVFMKQGKTLAVFLPTRKLGDGFGDFHHVILKPVRKE